MVRAAVRDLRQRAGWKQQELAARIGVSRQALSAIEAGETVPSTTLALELARALDCRVEDLFALEDGGRNIEATLVAERLSSGRRLALGLVAGRWLAHPLEGEPLVPADAIEAGPGRSGRVCVEPLRDRETLQTNLLVAGCDPALGLLAGHLGQGVRPLRLHWFERASGAALEGLARGEVHLAGAHLHDNVAAARARSGDRPMVLVNVASWEQGLVVAPGNPKRIRTAADLARVRVVTREVGAGARELLERLLKEVKVRHSTLRIVATAGGHQAVARLVAAGSADVGVATRAAAVSSGMDFVPLAVARFDLVIPTALVADPRVQRLIETLASLRFRRELGAVPGYETGRTGATVAEVA